MKPKQNFKILLLLARPAAGKSEIIQFLQSVPEMERLKLFHIGKICVIDDFPMIWSWFEEDDLLSEMGQPHLYTDANGYFLKQFYWNLLIRKMILEFHKFSRDHTNIEDYTVIMEFSRGKEHGGYREAFSQIPQSFAQRAAILYLNISWEESLRKNRRRFNPQKPDSILEHSLPDKKLERMYKETDWDELTAKNNKYININSAMVPYAVMQNEDDITSGNNKEELSKRLKTTLLYLWDCYNNKN